MAKGLFREKSLNYISSPEQLNDYLKVTKPAVWIVLIAIIVLLLGLFVWGSFAYIGSSIEGVANVEENTIVMEFKSQKFAENVKEGSRIYLAYERTDGDREQVQYSYFVEGSRIDYTHYNLSADNLKNIDFKKLEETLRQDDYVYTLSVTEGINKAFTAYNGGKDLKDYTLYSVEDEGGKVVLKEIGR